MTVGSAFEMTEQGAVVEIEIPGVDVDPPPGAASPARRAKRKSVPIMKAVAQAALDALGEVDGSRV
jgi:hypothetical protein